MRLNHTCEDMQAAIKLLH